MSNALSKITTFAAIVAGVLSYQGVRYLMSDSDPSGMAHATTGTVDEDNLAAVAEHYNAKLPMMVDNETRWDTSSTGPGLTLNYHYTVVNYAADEIDAAQIKQAQFEATKNAVCGNPGLRLYWTSGVTLRYDYRGKNGAYIMDFSVSPGDCGF